MGSRRTKLSSQKRGVVTLVLVTSLLVLVALLLYVGTLQRFEDFKRAQHELMDKSAQDTARTIQLYIEQARRTVALFAVKEQAAISALSGDPGNTALQTTIENSLARYLPDFAAFTVADASGRTFFDDFDGVIGEVCRKDISAFAETDHPRKLVIHPNPEHYHFDIMAPVQLQKGVSGVFFVSFKSSMLSQLLANSELHGHQILLVNNEQEGLIEVSARGSRDKMNRDPMLSETELSAIDIRYPVPGSLWTVVYLTDAALYANKLDRLRRDAFQYFVIVLLMSLALLAVIRHKEKLRKSAERLLEEANEQLENRVEARTSQLYRANTELQGEIAERAHAQEELIRSEQRYALAAKGANDGIWEWEAASGLIHFSERWREVSGITGIPEDGTFDDWLACMDDDDKALFSSALDNVLEGHSNECAVEYRLPDESGGQRWFRCRAAVERDADGRAIRIAGSNSDITDQKLAEEQLRFDALHDALTGLPNRTLFLDRLEQAINTFLRNADHPYAVMFLDIDRFKDVNDSLGHHGGDKLLKSFGKRLGACLRPGDTLARLGGDEFIVLMNDFNGVGDITSLAERILAAMDEPYSISGQEVFTRVSIGIALGTDRYHDATSVLRDSDIAMYRAKETGTGGYFVFNENIREEILSRIHTETFLRKAVERDQLVVYYQPIIDLQKGTLHGFEALLRWLHPEKGMVMPDEFIPLAEDSGLIIPIGMWVMEEACKQAERWQKKYHYFNALSLSVNLSCKQFLQADLAARVQQVMQTTHVDESSISLNLEITETVVMQNASCSTDIFRDLKALGIRLAVDDFGTGYSSLAYLQSFPVDMLKIDKQFVSHIDTDKDSYAIVKTVIDLSNNLGLAVVAEGVETQEQFRLLSEMGCQFAQGYYFSRPVSAEDAEALMAGNVSWTTSGN